MSDFTRQELADIALAAAKEASRQTISEIFSVLGVNIADFTQMQRLRDNLSFINTLRSGAGNIGARVLMTVVSIASGAIAIAAWEILKKLLMAK